MMVGKAPKRSPPKFEPRQLRSSTLAASISRQSPWRSQETPKQTKSTALPSGSVEGTFMELQAVDALIQRYMQSGQRKTALFWVDKRLSLCQKEGQDPSFLNMAEFLKALAANGEWTRIISYVKRFDLKMKHLVFAYYYVSALYHRKLYDEIMKLKLSSLEGFANPVASMEPFKSEVFGAKSYLPTKKEKALLDGMADDLKLEAGLLVFLGKAYLVNQNRRDAQLCLEAAVDKDACLIEALELIQKFNLFKSKQEFANLVESVCSTDCGVKDAFKHFYFLQGKFLDNSQQHALLEIAKMDLSMRTAYASYLYEVGDIVGANQVTAKILDETGIYQDCLLVHIATLVLLQKSQDLFMLGGKLVDTEPENEISWYCVGCYYYTIHNYAMAKNFLNKCTMMKPSFGEGWLAFGHVLTAESEHEQATNCYLRASRNHEGSFEPFMYAGLEYAYANSIKLAQDFLKDSAERAGQNALVLHEQACIFYMNKDYEAADEHFTKALKGAYGRPLAEKANVVSLLHLTLSDFWEPLVSNLAHVRRRRGKFSDALKFYQKSLTMRPRNAAALCGMATTYASLGEFQLASQFFNEALGVEPQNPTIKQGLEKLLGCLENNPVISASPFTTSLNSEDALDPILTQTDAQVFDEPLTEQMKWAFRVSKTKPRKKLPKPDKAMGLKSREAVVGAGSSAKTPSVFVEVFEQDAEAGSSMNSTADMEIDEEDE